MAIDIVTLQGFYKCLSTDTKPVGPSDGLRSFLLYEIDTGTWYIHNETTWVEFNFPPAGAGA